MTEVQKAWLAGFYEGEGCVYEKRITSPRLTISQVEEDVILDIQALLESEGITSSVEYRDNSTQGINILTIHGRARITQFHQLIRPYMRHDRKIHQLEQVATFTETAATKRVLEHLANTLLKEG
jgi:intein/homing endonuclease